MLFPAHVRNGLIVPDAPVTLPEGAAVTILHEESAPANEESVQEAATSQLESLIKEAKQNSAIPEHLTPEEAALCKQAMLELFRDMENDPPIPLESLDREYLYGNDD
ncbi:MAG: hypothetical protein ACR2IE_20710 [Candidatus Sumerlaeaceae bacterium]